MNYRMNYQSMPMYGPGAGLSNVQRGPYMREGAMDMLCLRSGTFCLSCERSFTASL